MIRLGNKVRDKVSGIEGIVTGRCEYLNGCVQYCVTTKVAADAFIAKHGPDPANWPESMRPKVPAPDAAQN